MVKNKKVKIKEGYEIEYWWHEEVNMTPGILSELDLYYIQEKVDTGSWEGQLWVGDEYHVGDWRVLKAPLCDMPADKKTQFRLTKKGVVWVKINDQGMNNQCAYLKTVIKTNTRCQRLGYKHKYCNNSTTFIYPVYN